MLDYSRRKLRSKIYLNGLTKKIRGSIKEPSFRFWLVGLILVVFVFVNLSLIKNYLPENNVFHPASVSAVIQEHNKDDFFVSPLSGFSPESPEVILIGDSFVKASSPIAFVSPQILGLSAIDYQEQPETRTEIIEHYVQPGETLSSLAEKYNISLETVLWANSLTKTSKLKTDQKLVILPVSGIVHYAKSGDTVSGLAQRYKGSSKEIISFNNFSDEADIVIGDLIIIPDGLMPAPTIQKQSSSIASSPTSSSVPLASSYFIDPVPSPYIITQGLHWYNAIDFAHQGYSCGKPVYAAAGGIIQRTGYHGTAGNYIRIEHPNGVVTFYGHLMDNILVLPNQLVSQGETIGYIGNTGYTIGRTGCHLHFEVRGAANPFNR
jgi:LysM repeat protein